MYISIQQISNGFIIESHVDRTYVATADEIGAIVTAALNTPVLPFNGLESVGGYPTINAPTSAPLVTESPSTTNSAEATS